MVGGAASAARVSVRAVICVSTALIPCALTAGDLGPFYTGPQQYLVASSPWLGMLIILLGFIPLLIGWRLIRWTTALISCGISIGAVLFMAHDHWSAALAWTLALSCGVFGGALGWFLYPLISAAQSAVLAAGLTFVAMQMITPTMPALWYGIACGMGVTAAIIGWKTAAVFAIFHTVMIGYLGVLSGMTMICQPTTNGEFLLLALVIGGIAIPVGGLIQWRAHQRSQKPC